MLVRVMKAASLLLCGALLCACFAPSPKAAQYCPEPVGTLEQPRHASTIYTNVDDDHAIIHVNASLLDGTSKELFRIDNCIVSERPLLVRGPDCLYLLLSNDFLSESEVFSGGEEPDPDGLNVGARGNPNPRIFKYGFASGAIEEIKIKNPTKTLLLDGMLYQGNLVTIAEFQKNRTCTWANGWIPQASSAVRQKN